MPTANLGLQDCLSTARPLYVLPEDPVNIEVLIPALKSTKSLDIMMGYFSSASLSDIAPGLATFLRYSCDPMRLIISPYLTENDYNVFSQDETVLRDISQKLFLNEIPDEESLVHHTMECIAWLITEKRLIVRIAVMKNALFHLKSWLFDDGQNRAALHGSTNMTSAGLNRNCEQLTLSRGWIGDDPEFHIKRLNQEFENLWNGISNSVSVIPLPDAVAQDIVKLYKTDSKPKEIKSTIDSQIFNLETRDNHKSSISSTYNSLTIPKNINFESGPYSHQGDAVKSWEDSSYRGILEMATGSGKTKTSMIAATRLQDTIEKLLIVVSAPFLPLIEQWCGEIEDFNIQPVNLSNVDGPNGRNREIRKAKRQLKMNISRTEVLVVSHDTLCTEKFIHDISEINVPKLLIADEVHNLGAPLFISSPPEIFDYRIGLSATPVRQYDNEGTEALISFFGDICYTFSLEDAINSCLTEYDYFVHFVDLNDDEMDYWRELTRRISQYAWQIKANKVNTHIESLLRERRLILETAAGKIGKLAELLDLKNIREMNYTLIYATDKDPEQLRMVNRILSNRGVEYRQITSEETQSRKKTKELLSDFKSGKIRILTAKRVLDEGVNIPQIKLAFVLASTTVKKQWIQRRGRLLRTCKEIDKTHATIHDFVVVPPGISDSSSIDDPDARRIVRSELERVWEFARLSRNGPTEGGPYEAVSRLQELANERIVR